MRAPSNLQKRVVSAYECRPPPFAPVAAGAARPRPLVDSDKVPARRFGGGDGVLIARPVVELEAQRRLAERLACPSPSPPRPPSRVGTRLQSARSAPARHPTRQRAERAPARDTRQRAPLHLTKGVGAGSHIYCRLVRALGASGCGLFMTHFVSTKHSGLPRITHVSLGVEKKLQNDLARHSSFCPRGAQRSAPRPARACPCLASSSRRPKRQSRSRERYTTDGLTLHPFGAATRRDRVDVPSSLGPAHDDQADAIDCHRWVNAPSKPLCPPFVVDPRLHP